MKRRRILLILLCAIFSTTPLFAQRILLFGTASLPIGDFGKNLGSDPLVTAKNGFDVGENAGFAATGLGLGADIAFPTGLSGLSWISGLSLLINGTDEAMLTQTFNSLVGDSEEVAFEYNSWIQMPVMTGFIYDLKVMDNLYAYGMIQAGIDFIKPATRKAMVAGETVDEREYEIGRHFGYGLGGGVVLADRINIGLRYLDFGKALFDGERNLDLDYFDDADHKIGKDVILGEKRPVKVLLVTLGYQF